MDWLEHFRGRSVLVTGHTGFKGGWIATWLQALGARVTGVALEPDPPSPSFFDLVGVADGMDSHIADIRDLDGLKAIVDAARPDVVIHMAAQALVRESYRDPVGTYATNVLGTVHVLEAVRGVESVRCVVNVTTDKCYENRGWAWGYREIDTLGGHDPYSSSKAASEIVTSAYRRSFFQDRSSARIATARAGNAIGGGDWSAERLIPDVVRALEAGRPVVVRNPAAVRPWQHVLDPLAGYLLLAARLAGEDGERFEGAWNFGPSDASAVPVGDVVAELDRLWPGRSVEVQGPPDGEAPHEAHLLRLDVSKAVRELGWAPVWDLRDALGATASWYDAYLRGDGSLRDVTLAQIEDYTRRLEGGD